MMKTRRILARSKRMAGYHVPDYTHGFRRWIGRPLNAREHRFINYVERMRIRQGGVRCKYEYHKSTQPLYDLAVQYIKYYTTVVYPGRQSLIIFPYKGKSDAYIREHGLTNAYASTMMRPEHARGLTFHAALVADHWLVPSQLPNYTSSHRYYGKKIIVRDVLRHTIEPVLMDVPGACLIYITQHLWPDKEDNPVPLSTLHPVFTTIEVTLGQPAAPNPITSTHSTTNDTTQGRDGPASAVAVSAAKSQTDSKSPLTYWYTKKPRRGGDLSNPGLFLSGGTRIYTPPQPRMGLHKGLQWPSTIRKTAHPVRTSLRDVSDNQVITFHKSAT